MCRVPRYGRASFRVGENVGGMGGVTRRFTREPKRVQMGGDFALHRAYVAVLLSLAAPRLFLARQ